MYAIVEINGQQFKAEAGKKLFVHHIQNAENGADVYKRQVSSCIAANGLEKRVRKENRFLSVLPSPV